MGRQDRKLIQRVDTRLRGRFTLASYSQGHITVLEWWKNLSTAIDDSNVDNPKIKLKPGKSICSATQNGHTIVVRW